MQPIDLAPCQIMAVKWPPDGALSNQAATQREDNHYRCASKRSAKKPTTPVECFSQPGIGPQSFTSEYQALTASMLLKLPAGNCPSKAKYAPGGGEGVGVDVCEIG